MQRKTSRVEGDEVGRGPSQEQCHDSVCSHLWQCGRNRAALGPLHTAVGWGQTARYTPWEMEPIGSGVRARKYSASKEPFCATSIMSASIGAAATTCRSHQPDPWRRTQQKRLRRGAVQQVLKRRPSIWRDRKARSRRSASPPNGYRWQTNRAGLLWITLVRLNWACRSVRE